jgi:hypothetical protein
MSETPPARRGPGRPRKAAEKPAESEAPAQAKPDDERIGNEVDALWLHVTYADGRCYRCEDGKIVERLS